MMVLCVSSVCGSLAAATAQDELESTSEANPSETVLTPSAEVVESGESIIEFVESTEAAETTRPELGERSAIAPLTSRELEDEVEKEFKEFDVQRPDRLELPKDRTDEFLLAPYQTVMQRLDSQSLLVCVLQNNVLEKQRTVAKQVGERLVYETETYVERGRDQKVFDFDDLQIFRANGTRVERSQYSEIFERETQALFFPVPNLLQQAWQEVLRPDVIVVTTVPQARPRKIVENPDASPDSSTSISAHSSELKELPWLGTSDLQAHSTAGGMTTIYVNRLQPRTRTVEQIDPDSGETRTVEVTEFGFGETCYHRHFEFVHRDGNAIHPIQLSMIDRKNPITVLMLPRGQQPVRCGDPENPGEDEPCNNIYRDEALFAYSPLVPETSYADDVRETFLHLQQAQLLFDSLRIDEAAKELAQVFTRDATVAKWYYVLAFYQHQMGRETDAAAALHYAADMESSDPIKNWSEAMSRYQGDSRIWLEDQRSEAISRSDETPIAKRADTSDRELAKDAPAPVPMKVVPSDVASDSKKAEPPVSSRAELAPPEAPAPLVSREDATSTNGPRNTPGAKEPGKRAPHPIRDRKPILVSIKRSDDRLEICRWNPTMISRSVTMACVKSVLQGGRYVDVSETFEVTQVSPEGILRLELSDDQLQFQFGDGRVIPESSLDSIFSESRVVVFFSNKSMRNAAWFSLLRPDVIIATHMDEPELGWENTELPGCEKELPHISLPALELFADGTLQVVDRRVVWNRNRIYTEIYTETRTRTESRNGEQVETTYSVPVEVAKTRTESFDPTGFVDIDAEPYSHHALLRRVESGSGFLELENDYGGSRLPEAFRDLFQDTALFHMPSTGDHTDRAGSLQPSQFYNALGDNELEKATRLLLNADSLDEHATIAIYHLAFHLNQNGDRDLAESIARIATQAEALYPVSIAKWGSQMEGWQGPFRWWIEDLRRAQSGS